MGSGARADDVAAYHLFVPVVLRYKGFQLFFYSNEGSPREPMHVHVRGDGREAKYWMRPDVRVATATVAMRGPCANWRM